MKIHLDTDFGGDIDDLCALAFLLKRPEVEIVGITTVAEESGRRAGYLKYVLNVANKKNIPLKSGADVAHNHFRYKPTYYDDALMWPEKTTAHDTPVDSALELLKQSIDQAATIITIGPLTNLALLEKKYAGILNKANIIIMGGYIAPPEEGYVQWTNDYDYNFQLDVSSAKLVLENSNPLLVPLPICLQTAICRSDVPQLQTGDNIAQLIAHQALAFDKLNNNAENIGKRSAKIPNDIINFQYDPLTCAIAINAIEYEIEEVPLVIEIHDAWIHQTPSPEGKHFKVVTQVNGQEFNKCWLSTITST